MVKFWRLCFQGNLEQERLKKQQQQELAAAALYQQLQQQQQLFQLINRWPNTIIQPRRFVWYLWNILVLTRVASCVCQVQWAGYNAFDEQVDVSARYRVHVGHAYLSLTAVRYFYFLHLKSSTSNSQPQTLTCSVRLFPFRQWGQSLGLNNESFYSGSSSWTASEGQFSLFFLIHTKLSSLIQRPVPLSSSRRGETLNSGRSARRRSSVRGGRRRGGSRRSRNGGRRRRCSDASRWDERRKTSSGSVVDFG